MELDKPCHWLWERERKWEGRERYFGEEVYEPESCSLSATGRGRFRGCLPHQLESERDLELPVEDVLAQVSSEASCL